MNKSVFVMLVLLASCTVPQSSYEQVDESVSKDEFIEEVINQNNALKDENKQLEGKIDELEGQAGMLQEGNIILRKRIVEMENMLKATPGPKDRLQRGDVVLLRDKAEIKAENAFMTLFLDTKSMEPVINKHTIGLQIPPDGEELGIGDIVAFRTNFTESIVVHRVISTGKDSEGWFAVTKGDNNPYPDQSKVRRDDIVGITIALIY